VKSRRRWSWKTLAKTEVSRAWHVNRQSTSPLADYAGR